MARSKTCIKSSRDEAKTTFHSCKEGNLDEKYRIIENIYRIFSFSREYKWIFVADGICILLASFLSTAPIKYIEKSINIAVGNDPDKIHLFFIACLIYLILHISSIVFNTLSDYTTAVLETKIGHKLGVTLFSKLQYIIF